MGLYNKTGSTMNEFGKDIREELKVLSYSLLLYISVLTPQADFSGADSVDFVVEQHHRRIPTAELNRVLNEAMMLNPARRRRKAGEDLLRYPGKHGTAPLLVLGPATTRRWFTWATGVYLENTLRQNFGLKVQSAV